MKDLPLPNHKMFPARVREILQTFMGLAGRAEDRLVTLGELLGAGVVDTSGDILIPGPQLPGEPDLTPPPTPTGLTVTAGLTRLIVEWDDPVYTQGHGHDRTILYGATYPGTGPLPTFSSAVELKTALGSITDYVTNPNTQWHLWAKWQSKDGVLSVTPAGGTNGVTATTGKVGNSDLNDLIITSQKIAAGAVDAFSKFSGGLEPVLAVTSLPATAGYTGPKTVLLTTDNKLYRFTGSAWTSVVPAADITGQLTNAQIADLAAAKITGQITSTQITDSAVTTPKLNAGAVTTAKIAANAVTANEIAANTITAAQIAADTITGSQIAANTITSSELAADSVIAGKIAAGAVIAGKIGANAIVAGDGAIANAAITNALIANLAVDSAKIADGAIVTAKIGDANVTTAKIATANITTALIADANVTTAKIADANITSAKIADANITSAKIADANITTAKIADAQITTLKIGSNQVTVPLSVSGSAVSITGNATAGTRTTVATSASTSIDSGVNVIVSCTVIATTIIGTSTTNLWLTGTNGTGGTVTTSMNQWAVNSLRQDPLLAVFTLPASGNWTFSLEAQRFDNTATISLSTTMFVLVAKR